MFISQEPLHDALLAVKNLIKTPATWTTDFNAVASNGVPIDPTDPDACRWCLLGAMIKVIADATTDRADRASLYDTIQIHLHNVADKLQWRNFFYLADINDRGGLDAVHQLLDAAIVELSPQQVVS